MLAPAASSRAQELNESLNVEGVYKREVIPVERINLLPSLMDIDIAEKPLGYETAAVPAMFSPTSPILPATAWGDVRSRRPGQGYIDLFMGSWLNASLSAGVAPIQTADTRLNIRLQHNSTSLWAPYKNMETPANYPAGTTSPSDIKRKSYQEHLGLDFLRRFAKGSLSASAQYHLGYFNYYGIIAKSAPFRTAPTQTLNDAALRIGWKSPADASTTWQVAAGARYFGYRTATRETQINLTGTLRSFVSESSNFGVNADGSLLLYGSHPGIVKPANYGALSITPFYEYRRGNFLMRLGVDLDFTFNADGNEAGEKYSVFHASPDVKFSVGGSGVNFYVNVLGGQTLHTLAATSEYDPYRNPRLESTQPVYIPIDANIGLNVNPFSGFEAGVNLRLASTRHAPMGGWYMFRPHFEEDIYRYNLFGFQVGLNLNYRLNDLLKIKFEGAYTPQHDRTGVFNGLDRPRWTLDACAEVCPIKGLSIGLGYEYRGVRNIYCIDGAAPAAGNNSSAVDMIKDEPPIAARRLGDITNMYFNAAYEITQNIALSFRADNLLNRRVDLLPNLPLEGVTFLGGVQILF